VTAPGQARDAAPAVVLGRPDRDQAVGLQRPQQPAEIARVEPQPRAQLAYLAALLADLPQDARLPERPTAAEEALVERAGALGDRAVEAADVGDQLRVDSLTLVRELWARHPEAQIGQLPGQFSIPRSPQMATSSSSAGARPRGVRAR